MNKKTLLLLPIVFVISFYVGLHLRKEKTSVVIPLINSNQLQENSTFTDPLKPQQGHIFLKKNNYYFDLSYIYYSPMNYCIHGTIYSSISGKLDINGCVENNTTNLTVFSEAKQSYVSGVTSLAETVLNNIFFVNELLAKNEIKIYPNGTIVGNWSGSWSKISENCYNVIITNGNTTYQKQVCFLGNK